LIGSRRGSGRRGSQLLEVDLGVRELGWVDTAASLYQGTAGFIGAGVVDGENGVDQAVPQIEDREVERLAVTPPDQLVPA
jgi:hypothetical protein